MAMGKRKRKLRQQSMWIATQELPRSASHPFYKRLNRILEQNGFDEYVEQLCESFYAPTMGRPSLAPGMYFRLLMLGYFEGIDSERGIAWRAADSLSVREFVGLELGEAPPDHSTVSRTRRLIDVETHRAVFSWILDRLAAAGLVKGETLGVDATTLEANAALRSIVRRDTGEGYEAFLTRLAKASGIATPTREDLARLDRKRPKKGSNDDWTHPQDPDARITKMKDGRTHLAHKAEHAVDLETGAVVAVTVQPADKGDTETVKETLIEAAENVEKAKPQTEVVKELVTDKGYHSNALLEDLAILGVRTYISEPARGRRNWKGKHPARNAVYGNRRRIRGTRGRRLLRQRGERLERPFAHAYETGGLRRVYLRGHSNILKRVLIHTAALNLGLLMRLLVGVGTPRSLQGRLWASLMRLVLLWCRVIKEYLAVSCVRENRRSSLIGMRSVLCS
jgi:transposase